MHQDDSVWEDAEEVPGGPLRRRLRAAPPRKKLAQILDELASDATRPRISLADLVQAMHGRAFGALLLVFAFPNAIPAIPGTSSILGLPLLFLSAQMMLGREVWLPKVVSLRSMSRDDFANLVDRVTPWLDWADRFTAPRLAILNDPLAQKLIGAFCLILSIVLVLPIPLGNMLPGIALCLIALGVLERDGLWVMGGALVGVAALTVAWGVVYAIVRTTWYLVLNAF